VHQVGFSLNWHVYFRDVAVDEILRMNVYGTNGLLITFTLGNFNSGINLNCGDEVKIGSGVLLSQTEDEISKIGKRRN